MINEDMLSDEEKSFNQWLSQTQCVIKYNDLNIVKKAYMDGYAAGWHRRKTHNVEEQLQK